MQLANRHADSRTFSGLFPVPVPVTVNLNCTAHKLTVVAKRAAKSGGIGGEGGNLYFLNLFCFSEVVGV